MPAQTTISPLRVDCNAMGTRSPAGAKIMAASSSVGGLSKELPAHLAPKRLANV